MSRTPVIGDVIADRYELEELCGSGGMSTVFRASDRLLDRRVALKILHEHYADDADYVERFRREARAVAQLSHPHIVTVIDRGEDGGRQFIVFEYVEGENLKELVGRSGRLPLRRAVEIAIDVAEGLAFAHQNGLVHRDVKPQNVLVDEEGEIKVTDFGIARSLDVDHGVTQTGTVMGTSNYISPEQANGRPVTPATDVYSLGIVLWELLTGEVPFPGENFVAVALRHINDPTPNLLELRPDAPPRLAAVTDRALAKEPERRFPSMEAFAAELRSVLAELDGADPAGTAVLPAAQPGPRLRPRRRRATRRVLAIALIVLVAAAAIVAGVLGLGGSDNHKTTGNGGGSAAGTHVALSGVTSYDPYSSDHSEHPERAPSAADRDASTYWETQIYHYPNGGLGKKGVGVVVGAGSPVALKSLTVQSDTPGFRAEILAGDSQSGPFVVDSSSMQVGSRTTFALRGRTSRYYVVWITNLGSHSAVHVNEVAGAS